MPEVCRLGLATRGDLRLRPEDVEWALARGVNYLNWCGHPDALSQTLADLGPERSKVVLAVQFESRSGADAAPEFEGMLAELRTAYLDIATLYYVESEEEWQKSFLQAALWNTLSPKSKPVAFIRSDLPAISGRSLPVGRERASLIC